MQKKVYSEYFLPIIYYAIVSIDERFQQLAHHSNNFFFLIFHTLNKKKSSLEFLIILKITCK